VLEARDFPLEQVSDYLEQDDCVVWADLCTPDAEELHVLADELGLDPLAVEDAVGRYERPKVDRYPTHLFVHVYGVRFDPDGTLLHDKVSAFVLTRALVTVRTATFDVEAVLRAWDADADQLGYGVDALLHGLLDVVVDSHFDAVQQLDDRIEDLEDALFDEGPRTVDVQRSTYELRKNLVAMRKLALPMREVVGAVLHHREQARSGELAESFRDLDDHVQRVAEWTDSLRDLITTVYETNLSLADRRLNDVVRKLSAWAAIIAVPTAVTGFYGQNVPYPGFGHWSGFVTSTVVTILLAGSFYLSFKRRGWL
jgi:magnesium transporter